MKPDKDGCVEMIHFPIEETGAVIIAMRRAEQAGDLAALQWCARRLIWLYELFEDDTFEICDPYILPKAFDGFWQRLSKTDPPPESIAAIIAKIGQERLP